MLLEKLRKQIESKAKGMHISVLSESEIAKVDKDKWLSSPSYDLNRILSGSLLRGIPRKTHMLLVGPEASFKSSCMAIMIAAAQKAGLTPIIIDTEASWTSEFVTRWGIDPDNVLYIYSPWVDEIMVTLTQILEAEDKNFIIAIDSIGGLDRYKLIEDGLKGEIKADQGTLQKELKRMLKILVNICKSKDSVCLTSGHLYGNPSGYGAAENIGGGFYLKLSADIIVSLKKSKLQDKDKNVIGNEISAITLKNRFYPPFQEATVEIDYKRGINKYAGLLDIASETGIIQEGAMRWYTHIKSGEKLQGDKAIKFFEQDPTILEEIEEYLKTTGYSSFNKDVALANGMENETREEAEEKIVIEKKLLNEEELKNEEVV
jgi:RecA/RadA recombinase